MAAIQATALIPPYLFITFAQILYAMPLSQRMVHQKAFRVSKLPLLRILRSSNRLPKLASSRCDTASSSGGDTFYSKRSRSKYPFSVPSIFDSSSISSFSPASRHQPGSIILPLRTLRIPSLGEILRGRSGTTNDDVDMKKEISKMRLKEIRQEMEKLGVVYSDLLEKSEFVERLYEARLGTLESTYIKGKTSQGVGEEHTATADATDGSRAGGAQDPDLSSQSSSSSSSSPSIDRGDVIQAVSKLKIKEIKQELDERGVSYKGLFERKDFMDLLIDARMQQPEEGKGSQPQNTVNVVEAEIISDNEFKSAQGEQQGEGNTGK